MELQIPIFERKVFMMALTGTKICAVCGNEFKGAGNLCKDGYYCNDCEKKIRRVFQEDEEDYLSAADIRKKLNKYADAIAAYDSIIKPETCPVCGKNRFLSRQLSGADGRIQAESFTTRMHFESYTR